MFRRLGQLVRASTAYSDSYTGYGVVAGGLGLACYSLTQTTQNEAEGKEFSIPQMLAEREAKKKQEYAERQAVGVAEITEAGLTQEEAEELSEADKAFMLHQSKVNSETGEIEPEDEYSEDFGASESQIMDPYVKKRVNKQTHQEYRKIKIGHVDLLKQGQMIQVSVCDPFDESKFHPTDKIIVLKHQDQYYALGAFCGFDYSLLAKGALIGEKLICPTCASAYDIKNGYVDQGPTMRNISSFMIQTRDDEISVIIPEHVPAFAYRKKLKQSNIDPRRMVVLGDTEAAVACVDALRTSFTGEILLITTSPFGQFENIDVIRRKFGPIAKNEIYYMEDDFFQKAGIKVMAGELKYLDVDKKEISLVGESKKIAFDKLLIAWGSEKKKLKQQFSNVYYLEDKQSHARVHNELLRAKSVVVFGGTLEAYQVAAGVRDYLDSIGYTQTRITLMCSDKDELLQNFGTKVKNAILKKYHDKRITVLSDVQITQMQGTTKLDSIHFRDKQNQKPEKLFSKEGIIENFIKPDMVIVENGLGRPKFDLIDKFEQKEDGALTRLGVDASTGYPACNLRFSLQWSDIQSSVYAAGSCTQFPSFIHSVRLRTDDVKYNVEMGFYAAMNMMDKRVEWRYIPLTHFKIGDCPINFVGERNQAFTEIIISGDIESGKFVAFYVYGDEIIGFVTVGFQNLHLYLWEAMKKLMMPTATMMNAADGDYSSIVASVLKMAPYLESQRQHTVNTPSILMAEHGHEIEKMSELRSKMNANIREANEQQKQKMEKIKAKYDREGVKYIEDEDQIGREQEQPQKHSQEFDRMQFSPVLRRQKQQEINMGGQEPSYGNNPFKKMFETGHNLFKPPK